MKTIAIILQLGIGVLVIFPWAAPAASVAWTNLNGGLWSAATNWSPNTVPTPAPDVFITAAGNYTVTQDLHVAIASLTLGGASGTPTLTNAVANLTLNGASTVNATGVLGFGGGTLAVAGVLTVGGTVVWAGGTISGALTVATNGVLNINGSATKELSGTGNDRAFGRLPSHVTRSRRQAA